jgi:hypothetical protein
MTGTFRVDFASPPHEMAQEEILKQVAYLSQRIARPRFVDAGKALEFDAPDESGADLARDVQHLAARVQRSLRSLQRKVVYRSPAADRPTFREAGDLAGVHQMGPGQVALEGLPARLFRYFDRVFESFGDPWGAAPLITPTLIPAHVLAKCDYFRSFPNNVTFACHLPEDPPRIEDFRARHQQIDELDDRVLGDLVSPEACLSPAVCYHAYAMNRDRSIPAAGLAYGVCGKCFRRGGFPASTTGDDSPRPSATKSPISRHFPSIDA